MWEQINRNKRNSALLVFIMLIILLALGYSIGELLYPGHGPTGLFIGFILWIIQSLISYYFGDKIVLGISKARKIDREVHPTLFNVVEEMKIASSLPKIPDIYIVDDPALNAFATGRDPEHSAVTVTSGLLEIMSRDELQGVVAHELSHIRNRDVLYMTMVGIMLGTIVLIADLGIRSLFWTGGRRRTSSRDGGQGQLIIMIIALIFIILSPIIAQLIYLAISRKREYLADACAVQYTRYPLGLAGALEKIASSSEVLKSATKATSPMYIANPFKGKGNTLRNLSSTHPPIEERIRILRAMAGTGLEDYDNSYMKITGSLVGTIPFPHPVYDKSDIAVKESMGLVGSGQKSSSNKITTDSHISRTRESTDALWKLNNYIFTPCDCGTKLKIPQVYKNKIIQCPHCLREHRVAA